MTQPSEHGVESLLAALADEAAFGLAVDDANFIKDIPDSLNEQHRIAMMQVAGLTQLSFLRLDDNSCHKIPDRLRERLMRKADEFILRQSPHDNVTEMSAFRARDKPDLDKLHTADKSVKTSKTFS